MNTPDMKRVTAIFIYREIQERFYSLLVFDSDKANHGQQEKTNEILRINIGIE